MEGPLRLRRVLAAVRTLAAAPMARAAAGPDGALAAACPTPLDGAQRALASALAEADAAAAAAAAPAQPPAARPPAQPLGALPYPAARAPPDPEPAVPLQDGAGASVPPTAGAAAEPGGGGASGGADASGRDPDAEAAGAAAEAEGAAPGSAMQVDNEQDDDEEVRFHFASARSSPCLRPPRLFLLLAVLGVVGSMLQTRLARWIAVYCHSYRAVRCNTFM